MSDVRVLIRAGRLLRSRSQTAPSCPRKRKREGRHWCPRAASTTLLMATPSLTTASRANGHGQTCVHSFARMCLSSSALDIRTCKERGRPRSSRARARGLERQVSKADGTAKRTCICSHEQAGPSWSALNVRAFQGSRTSSKLVMYVESSCGAPSSHEPSSLVLAKPPTRRPSPLRRKRKREGRPWCPRVASTTSFVATPLPTASVADRTAKRACICLQERAVVGALEHERASLSAHRLRSSARTSYISSRVLARSLKTVGARRTRQLRERQHPRGDDRPKGSASMSSRGLVWRVWRWLWGHWVSTRRTGRRKGKAREAQEIRAQTHGECCADTREPRGEQERCNASRVGGP